MHRGKNLLTIGKHRDKDVPAEDVTPDKVVVENNLPGATSSDKLNQAV